ncbi:MAG: TauD/TfdA family dioxygenase [Acidobacteriota bacterium]|nr:TauD/TfdA family dioxygenase [Acidobacteriota bacterium]
MPEELIVCEGDRVLRSDEQNLDLVESVDSVDKLNAKFYGRFPYPWLAVKFDYLLDPHFETVMLNQSLGDWDNTILRKNSRIWVAGCGTNLAISTALRFPEATVLGSDLSSKSLEACGTTAKQLGISNLELKEESINHVTYKDQFDHIICTGVIHHNADPKATLDKLVAALKPTGVMELMVYNRYHEIIPVAFQKAVRLLGGNANSFDLEAELSITQKLVAQFPVENSIAAFLSKYEDCPETMLADELFQPVLYSYTVQSLEELAASCNLELLTPCINLFDKTEEKFSWNMEFPDPELQARYDSLPDLRRWQVSNLLLLEKSPMLWFYVQRKDSGRQRKSEKQICEEFLNTTFDKAGTKQRSYIMGNGGKYNLSPNARPFPLATPDSSVKAILDSIDSKTSMRDIFQRLGVKTTFQAVNQIRMRLATSAFPYLKAVRAVENEAPAQAGASVGKPHETLTGNERGQRIMQQKEREESGWKKFKSIKPKPVSLPQKKLIKTDYLRPEEMLPLIIQPAEEDINLADWAGNNLEFIETQLMKHGAILFRGFDVNAVSEFEEFALSICPKLFNENGEHPRKAISGNVYTPTFYPADKRILWHNENTFNHGWPMKIWFCCLVPAQHGGETPIVDSRRVYQLLDPRIRERFEQKGVMYVRNYGEGLGLDWQTVFRTNDRSAVEEQCRKAFIDLKWKDNDGLRTSCVRPGVTKHPKTGELSWFNQAQHWHISCLEPELRESLIEMFSEQDLPRNCYYGNGSRIEDSVMQEILEVYRQLEVSFRWQAGDILMLDNMLTAHARNPFVGERKILVAMGEMLSYDNV